MGQNQKYSRFFFVKKQKEIERTFSAGHESTEKRIHVDIFQRNKTPLVCRFQSYHVSTGPAGCESADLLYPDRLKPAQDTPLCFTGRQTPDKNSTRKGGPDIRIISKHQSIFPQESPRRTYKTTTGSYEFKMGPKSVRYFSYVLGGLMFCPWSILRFIDSECSSGLLQAAGVSICSSSITY